MFKKSEIDCAKLLSLTVDQEKKQERCFTEFIDNFKHFWINEFNVAYRNRLIEKKDEENNCKRLENRVENLKEQLQEINFNISNYESKIEELHVQVTNIDNEIQTKLCQKQELEKEQEKLKKKLGKLKKVDDILKESILMYDQYVGCNLIFESPDMFKLCFPYKKDDISGGFIKFKKCEYQNNFTIVEIEPKEILPETVIQKFHETQDTQGLLCLFRQLISGN